MDLSGASSPLPNPAITPSEIASTTRKSCADDKVFGASYGAFTLDPDLPPI